MRYGYISATPPEPYPDTHSLQLMQRRISRRDGMTSTARDNAAKGEMLICFYAHHD